ncbi:MAG: MFS transporter [Candidatus Eremiobacteraeota bacterium]|nr:MFS transporter [Candidatus Eremiobacteraeota bacterium]
MGNIVPLVKNWILFRNRTLFIFWVGQLTSRIGSFISYVALLLLVRELTGKNTTMAITGICQALPGLIVGLWAGAITDRVGKVRIMILTDVLRGLGCFIIPLCIYFHCLQAWHLYLVAVLISLGTAFFQPAEMAIIPDFVKREDLNSANAVARTTIQIGGIIGPALGALLITQWGAWTAFIADGITFFISAFCIMLMRVSQEKEKCESSDNLMEDVKEGIKLIWQNSPLKAILLCCIAVNFTYYPLPILLPEISERKFLDLTFFNKTQIFGAFIMTLTAGKLLASIMINSFNRFRHLKFFLYYSNIAIALAVLTVGVSRFLSLSFLAMAAIGFCGTITEVRIVSYIQSSFPENILGRIFGIILTVAFGTIPLSIFAGGWIADIVGSAWVLLGLGAGLVFTSLVIYFTGMLEGKNDVVSDSTTLVFVNKY